MIKLGQMVLKSLGTHDKLGQMVLKGVNWYTMIKLGQMVLKGVNWVHNGSNGLKNQGTHNAKIRS